MSLVYHLGKNLKCCRFTHLHKLIMSKPSSILLEEYLETEQGFYEVNSYTENGHTPLMLAVMNMGSLNRISFVESLLLNGANIDCLDSEGNSLLMLAVQYSTFKTENELLKFIQYLISQYADTTVMNYYRRTVIDISYARGYEKVMKYILEYNRYLSKVKI